MTQIFFSLTTSTAEVNVTFKEMKMMKGSIDLVASFALLSMASITILFGAFLSLSDRRKLYHPKSEIDSEGGQEITGANEGLEITEMSAAYFVVFASLVLLVIFFTMQHWVFVVIKFVFCFAAVQGLYALFFAIFVTMFKAMLQDVVDLPFLGQVHVLSIPSIFCSIATVITWVVNQERSWAWMLQDMMGMSFLVNVLRLVNLPNLKVGALLLVGAMCYDIFWVYIQPHLFGNESVMVKVAKVRSGTDFSFTQESNLSCDLSASSVLLLSASVSFFCVLFFSHNKLRPSFFIQGGEKHESLPMLFLFPRLRGNVGDFSMLGYGDIILPGLLIVHNHLFDNRCADFNDLPFSHSFALLQSLC